MAGPQETRSKAGQQSGQYFDRLDSVATITLYSTQLNSLQQRGVYSVGYRESAMYGLPQLGSPGVYCSTVSVNVYGCTHSPATTVPPPSSGE